MSSDVVHHAVSYDLRFFEETPSLLREPPPQRTVDSKLIPTCSEFAATSGAWQTRTLSTGVSDVFGLVSISSNEFTPTANGWVEWEAPANEVNGHQSRLYNVTDGAAVAYGTLMRSAPSASEVGISNGGAAVVANKAYRIEHRCADTKSSTGFGLAFSQGTEIYSRVKFWRA